ncbi:xanthine dehydrogenase subunit D [Halalkalibacterium halodurans]|uniref:Xanthine dehydrogenase n=1 Tax=Halalkalibacterium halodurans (strain ATCC BAA-125 / DSM 18197 / FERM 7344 / JCM 9153 / C-125) TaxID=272558 RepID=Q9KEV1_HALH5|nr:xanthine dehydrogenase subunit D [Halalkalibacterium halodurans]MED4122921.1 xanthine dehydrogenase subunit D [Halalkalibacterium halodurans]MED4172187.1 xanthine dehydrogenase subunit D [Halalkalibacterium halodurans]BAB04467.1 xanthine dehydrogenase [Halalkalibacterium halodurans C-125]
MRLTRHECGKRWRIRPDGKEKITGQLSYLTDRTLPDMLYGKVLRSKYPHGKLQNIDCSEALALPGVVAVITHKDVPGLNGYGISEPDHPVFCHEYVRYTGDAIAAVAAETKAVAEQALSLIHVDYEPLPVLDTPEKALAPDAPMLHPKGNILHKTAYKKGDVKQAFLDCAYIVEETYITPRQMHTYLETEGGLFVPGTDGRLTVYSATQHGYKDRMQLSRILGMAEENIRVISSPIGGSFGGKDELNVQPYGALLALHTGRPVNIHHSRRESVKAGIKRHPMTIRMKTGTDKEGRLLAHEVNILSDTGAYSTLGGPVLNFATEHAVGPYQFPHVEINGKAVFTNNGVSGEFRGFGGNQVIFAVEGQLDRLAEKMNIDPWELRRRNLKQTMEVGPLGQRMAPTTGAIDVWQAIKRSKLWSKKGSAENQQTPWLRRGVGMSLAMHGFGLGYGIPDPAGGRLRLNEEGKIEVAFGHEEFGQGLLGTIELMLQDLFHCEREDLKIVIGDTDCVPVSGSSTASRSTSMAWQTLQRLQAPFVEALLKKAATVSGWTPDQLRTGPGGIWTTVGQPKRVVTYQELIFDGTEDFTFETSFHFPVTPDPVVGGHYLYGFTAVMAEVEVNVLTGHVRVTHVDHEVAAGPVMNPMGYLGQIEGGSIMALGFTLTEDAMMVDGNYTTNNLDTYLIPTIMDVPEEQGVGAIESLVPGDEYGPRGVGEIGSVALAPAIASAVHQATGKWRSRLPLEPEALLEKHPLLELHSKGGV